MLLAVFYLTPRNAVRSQLYALAPLVALSLPGPAGTPPDWGYMLGRIGAAWILARLLESGPARPARAAVLAPLAAMAATAALAGWAWRAADSSLHLRTYYVAVLFLALAIAFYYTLRLVERPARIPVLVGGLWPYYAAGITWTLAMAALRPATASVPANAVDVIFHGLVTHLPGDVLTCVVVAALTGARRRV